MSAGVQGFAASRPEARKDRLVLEELDGELLIYDLESDRAHCLNGAAATVWQHCDGTRTVGELGELIAPGADPEVRLDAARAALSQLSRRNLLTDRISDEKGIPRRELMRKLAMAGAIGLAIPVVKSIVAPTAAQAATCFKHGEACGTGAQCCSGVCISGFCVGG